MKKTYYIFLDKIIMIDMKVLRKYESVFIIVKIFYSDMLMNQKPRDRMSYTIGIFGESLIRTIDFLPRCSIQVIYLFLIKKSTFPTLFFPSYNKKYHMPFSILSLSKLYNKTIFRGLFRFNKFIFRLLIFLCTFFRRLLY